MERLEETVRMAQACDAAGFDTFWLDEAYPWWRKHSMEARSSTAITAIVARETTRIHRLGNYFAVHAASGADRDGSARLAGSRRQRPLPPWTRRLKNIHEGDRRRGKGKGSRPGHGDARKHRDYRGHARRQRSEVRRQSLSSLCARFEA